jgi:hypothetical protein
VGLAGLIALAACGGGEVAGSTTIAPTTTTTTTSTIPTPTTPVPKPTTTSTQPGSSTTTNPGSDLPGEPIDFGPAEGDTLAVIGVAHDDLLNLRVAPGANQVILEGIPPLYDSLIALGETRQLPGAMWIAVSYEGTEGWVNLRYVGYLGETSDATSSVVDALGGTPRAGTMLGLGLIVAESLASEDPPSDLVVTAAPTVGDLGEIVSDVIGGGDDAVRGARAHVFGLPEDEVFVLETVELTTICGRGVTEDGFCI